MSTSLSMAEKLNRGLGPEWIKSKIEPEGKKLFYIQGHKAIKLANEMFGRDGWTRDIRHTAEDFCQVDPDGKVMVAMTATVRVTLVNNGSFHEDIGHGIGEHDTNKRVAMEKARWAAAFDGMKRALRKFGNVMGNCLYDTTFLKYMDPLVAPPSPLQQHPTPVSLTTSIKKTRIKKEPDCNPPMSSISRIKKEPLPTTSALSSVPSSSSSSSTTAESSLKKEEDSPRPALVAQESFALDEEDEALFIQMTDQQMDLKLLQRTCRENSHPPTKPWSPSHH